MGGVNDKLMGDVVKIRVGEISSLSEEGLINGSLIMKIADLLRERVFPRL